MRYDVRFVETVRRRHRLGVSIAALSREYRLDVAAVRALLREDSPDADRPGDAPEEAGR